MARPWIKLWTSFVDSDVNTEVSEWAFKLWMNLLAYCERSQTSFKGHTLKPNQIAFTMREFSERLNVSRNKLNRGLKELVSIGNISLETEKRFSLITIINWDKYQSTKTKSVVPPTEPSVVPPVEPKNDSLVSPVVPPVEPKNGKRPYSDLEYLDFTEEKTEPKTFPDEEEIGWLGRIWLNLKKGPKEFHEQIFDGLKYLLQWYTIDQLKAAIEDKTRNRFEWFGEFGKRMAANTGRVGSSNSKPAFRSGLKKFMEAHRDDPNF